MYVDWLYDININLDPLPILVHFWCLVKSGVLMQVGVK